MKKKIENQTKPKYVVTYKAITLGSSGVFISDNNGFKDLTELFKIPSHGISLRLPSQSTNKDFGKSSVIVLTGIVTTTNHLKWPLLRHGGGGETKSN